VQPHNPKEQNIITTKKTVLAFFMDSSLSALPAVGIDHES
jgi:hypothetical protein